MARRIKETARGSWTHATLAACQGPDPPPGCDVVFHCAEDAAQRVFAVKGMLALHSPVLRCLLFGGMREAAAARAVQGVPALGPWL